jgi:predicted SprT family Zn-dependent metalloprotease
LHCWFKYGLIDIVTIKYLQDVERGKSEFPFAKIDELSSMSLTKSVAPRAPLKSSTISSTGMDANAKSKIEDDLVDEKQATLEQSNTTKLEAMSAFIISKFQEHGLTASGWKWKWNNRLKTTAGTTEFESKTISLSSLYVTKATESEVKNTILHEIAHALTPGHNHDKIWKAKAKSIGCNGERCHEVETRGDNAYKWLFKCEKGCTSVPSITKRRKNGHRCALCKEKLMFIPVPPHK